MPVQEYRDMADMPRVPLARQSELTRRITALWQRAALMAHPRVPAGVQRFRTIEEANRARDAATLEQMRLGVSERPQAQR